MALHLFQHICLKTIMLENTILRYHPLLKWLLSVTCLCLCVKMQLLPGCSLNSLILGWKSERCWMGFTFWSKPQSHHSKNHCVIGKSRPFLFYRACQLWGLQTPKGLQQFQGAHVISHRLKDRVWHLLSPLHRQSPLQCFPNRRQQRLPMRLLVPICHRPRGLDLHVCQTGMQAIQHIR